MCLYIPLNSLRSYFRYIYKIKLSQNRLIKNLYRGTFNLHAVVKKMYLIKIFYFI